MVNRCCPVHYATRSRYVRSNRSYSSRRLNEELALKKLEEERLLAEFSLNKKICIQQKFIEEKYRV